jgi:hypothetical protein
LGYGICAQQELLRGDAAQHSLVLQQEFVDVETAKTAGRPGFNEMVAYLRAHPACRVLLVEKTDRLYRNFKDYVTNRRIPMSPLLPILIQPLMGMQQEARVRVLFTDATNRTRTKTASLFRMRFVPLCPALLLGRSHLLPRGPSTSHFSTRPASATVFRHEKYDGPCGNGIQDPIAVEIYYVDELRPDGRARKVGTKAAPKTPTPGITPVTVSPSA